MDTTLDILAGSALGLALACTHCGNPVPESRSDGFCCSGCRAVNRLLSEAGMQRYYALKPARLAPLLGYFDVRPSLDWLDQDPGLKEGRLDLAIEGIQCGACVWAIETLASRQGGASVGLNSALGRLSLRFDPACFDPKKFLKAVSDLGYRVRAQALGPEDPGRGLLLRLGVCAAVAMNTMSFSLPGYFGLARDGSGLLPALHWINFFLTLLSVAYGGSYFFGRACGDLRHFFYFKGFDS